MSRVSALLLPVAERCDDSQQALRVLPKERKGFGILRCEVITVDDPFEQQLRDLMREAEQQRPGSSDDERLERVLHKAHIRGGIFDLLGLFTRWGWVLTEGVGKGLRHGKPVRRANLSSNQSSE